VPKGTKDDITGKTYGMLLTLERSNKKSGFWKCLCECGKIKEIYGGHLRYGSILSCGCLAQWIEDLSGSNFGYLSVSKYLYSANQHNYWECVCACNKKIVSTSNNLKRGNTKSCGCMSVELQERTNMRKYGTKSSFQNSGVRDRFRKNNIKKYGVEYPAQDADIALKTAKSQKNSYILYHWKTGEEVVCTASYEKKVVEYLNRNKTDFKWQHRVFHMCLSSGKKTTYRPDLYLVGKRAPWVEIKGYFRGDAKEKWDIFHSQIKSNSELWDKLVLKNKEIL